MFVFFVYLPKIFYEYINILYKILEIIIYINKYNKCCIIIIKINKMFKLLTYLL